MSYGALDGRLEFRVTLAEAGALAHHYQCGKNRISRSPPHPFHKID